MSRGRRSNARAWSPPAVPSRLTLDEILSSGLADFARGVLSGELPVPGWLGLRGGGIAGDRDRHARDMIELAALACVADAELAQGILSLGLDHQLEHIERLSSARDHPRSSGAGVWKAYGFPFGREGTESSYRALQAAEADAKVMRDLIEGRRSMVTLARERPTPLRSLAIRMLVHAPLRRLLVESPLDGLRLARECATWMMDERMESQLAAAGLDDARATGRLVAAAQAEGKDSDPLDLLQHAPVPRHARLLLQRAGGDEGEDGLAAAWGGPPPDPKAPILIPRSPKRHDTHHPVLAAAEDAGTARARARGLLRRPEHHESGRGFTAAGRLASVPVTADAFRELFAEEASPTTILLRGPGATGTVRLALCRCGCVGDHNVEVRYLLDLGTTRARSISKILGEVRAHPDWPGPPDLEPSALRSWPRETERDGGFALERRLGGEPFPKADLGDLVGPDECAHANAGWELNHARDAAVLTCSRCLRRRIATVPLHRLPPEHELWLESGHDEDSYLRAERVHRALAGTDDLPQKATLERLRRSEGLADLAVGAHARVPAPVRVVARRGSLSAVLGRRPTS